MKTVWALQDAKNKFSQVVDQALKEGPQTVTRHGRECVMIVSTKAYKKQKKQGSLSEFFQRSPLSGVELDTLRSGDLPREVSL
jgi:prevent-host-death family protein